MNLASNHLSASVPIESVPIESVPVGSTVRIISVTSTSIGDGAAARQGVWGSAARRALELGLAVGVICRIVRKAPFGGPLEIEIGRTRIGIRPAADLRVLVQVC